MAISLGDKGFCSVLLSPKQQFLLRRPYKLVEGEAETDLRRVFIYLFFSLAILRETAISRSSFPFHKGGRRLMVLSIHP